VHGFATLVLLRDVPLHHGCFSRADIARLAPTFGITTA